MIAAAISATGVPASAASAVSWLAASAAEQPSRSMSAPLAMSMTERAAAPERDLVQLLPLAVDDRSQAQDVLAAARHRSPTFLPPPIGAGRELARSRRLCEHGMTMNARSPRSRLY